MPDLQGADLSGSLLRNLNFSGANLQDANLTGAGLIEANLQGANLRGANLSYIYLKKPKNLKLKQLCDVKTLYNAMLDPELKEQIKENCPHLLEEPIYSA
jgi:serine/threonine-protein kinase